MRCNAYPFRRAALAGLLWAVLTAGVQAAFTDRFALPCTPPAWLAHLAGDVSCSLLAVGEIARASHRHWRFSDYLLAMPAAMALFAAAVASALHVA